MVAAAKRATGQCSVDKKKRVQNGRVAFILVGLLSINKRIISKTAFLPLFVRGAAAFFFLIV